MSSRRTCTTDWHEAGTSSCIHLSQSVNRGPNLMAVFASAYDRSPTLCQPRRLVDLVVDHMSQNIFASCNQEAQEELGNKTKDRSTSSHVTMSDPKSQPGRTGRQQSRSNLHQSHGIAPPPIKFPSSSTSSVAQPPSHYTDNDFSDLESGERNISSGERAPLFRTGHHEGEGRPGLPKLSRECLWS
jgi:hypothetical protein